LNFLVQSKRLDRSLISLDGTIIPSQEFTEQTGYSGKHRAVGTKLSLLVDRAGTPLAVSVAPGNYHDGALGFLTVTNIYKPPAILRGILPDAAKTAVPTLLADKGYVVERTVGWLKGFRRLRYRVDRTAASFHAFVYLAILVLCVRRLLNPSHVRAPAR
jgi:transposase